ncbi:hypothetical protein [Halospeciosus flavus]|uniref:Uncharacterized protein n=1 Tax=Halospeciosus flavus TaxID=3032283 RepID=A0ABD5Z6T0_9EURY|nr:hypothetical protein [Halospeciosus flavus]
MATETADGMSSHRRGVTVTAVACLTGVAAGLLSSTLVDSPTATLGIAPLVGALVVNLGLIRVLGVDVDEFSGKDQLYTGFMTFCLWFITWGILLTSSA